MCREYTLRASHIQGTRRSRSIETCESVVMYIAAHRDGPYVRTSMCT